MVRLLIPSKIVLALCLGVLGACGDSKDSEPTTAAPLDVTLTVTPPVVAPGAEYELTIESNQPPQSDWAISPGSKPVSAKAQGQVWVAVTTLNAPDTLGDHLVTATGSMGADVVKAHTLVHVSTQAPCPQELVLEAGQCVQSSLGHRLNISHLMVAESPEQGGSGKAHPRMSHWVDNILVSCQTERLVVIEAQALPAIADLKASANASAQVSNMSEVSIDQAGFPQCETLLVDHERGLAVVTSNGDGETPGGIGVWKLGGTNKASTPQLTASQSKKRLGPTALAPNKTLYVGMPSGVMSYGLADNGVLENAKTTSLGSGFIPKTIAANDMGVLLGGVQGNEPQLKILSTDDKGALSSAGTLALSGVPTGIALLSDTTAALAVGGAGVDLVDFSDSSAPTKTNMRMPTPALSVSFSQGYLLVSGWTGLRLYDASLPGALRLLDATDGVVQTPFDGTDPYYPGLSMAAHVSFTGTQFVVSELNVVMTGEIKPGSDAPRINLHTRSQVVSPGSDPVGLGVRVENSGRQTLTVTVSPTETITPLQKTVAVAPGAQEFVEFTVVPPSELDGSSDVGHGLPMTQVQFFSNDPTQPMRPFIVASRQGNFELGDKAPVFKIPAINQCGDAACRMDQSCFDLAQAKGTPIVLAFMSAWCPVCGLEVPDLMQQVVAEFGDKSVQAYAVQVGDSASVMASFITTFGLTVPVLVDNAKEASACWEIPQKEKSVFDLYANRIGDPDSGALFPLQVVIDGEGNLAWMSRQHDPDALFSVLNALIDPR